MSAAVSEVLMKTLSQRTRPQLKAKKRMKKRMNSRTQRASSPGVGGQRNPRSWSSGWRRPEGSSPVFPVFPVVPARLVAWKPPYCCEARLAVVGWLEAPAAGARMWGRASA